MDIDESTGIHSVFLQEYYLSRQKVLKLLGAAFHIYDTNGNVLMYSEQKAFKLKEDIRIYSDETKSQELLIIKTPHVIDFSAKYYVHDATIGQDVGSLQRRGMKSMFKDEWIYFSPDEHEIGRLKESGTAILSRLFKFIPQKYKIFAESGKEVASVDQHFNPFVLKYSTWIKPGQQEIDPRLIIATGVLLAAIEGRQKD